MPRKKRVIKSPDETAAELVKDIAAAETPLVEETPSVEETTPVEDYVLTEDELRLKAKKYLGIEKSEFMTHAELIDWHKNKGK